MDIGCILTSTRWLVPDAILRGPSFEAVPLAADALLLLPQAARVERDDVGEPVGQGRDLVGLVPGQQTQVVVPIKHSLTLIVNLLVL